MNEIFYFAFFLCTNSSRSGTPLADLDSDKSLFAGFSATCARGFPHGPTLFWIFNNQHHGLIDPQAGICCLPCTRS